VAKKAGKSGESPSSRKAPAEAKPKTADRALPEKASPPRAKKAPTAEKPAKPAAGKVDGASAKPAAEKKPAAPKKAAKAAPAKPAKAAPVDAGDVVPDVDSDDIPEAAEEEAVAVVEALAPAVAKEAPPPAAPPPEPPPVPTDLPPRRADGTITLAHSPDPDDAFMFYALASGQVDTEDRKYEHVLKDIQTLNEDAKKGTYDVTALSFHAYPFVRRNYALLTCGASFGDGYGPILVAKTPIRPNEVNGLTVALPGALTTATLVTKLWFGRAKIRAANVPFDKVIDVVKAGMVRAGVLIHEGQLTYKEHGLVRVVDFGQWWSESTEGLPLPLGGNGLRRDIPKALATKIALDLKRSIAYALGHRDEALAYAMKFGRNLPKDKADKFVGMYVNDLTLDYGERGRQALLHLYDKAVKAGLLQPVAPPEYVG
jgi:1,4-dihydroxy-6-naphthoate synthase